MAEQLKAAGFTVTLDVVDWATLVQRRGDPALWDVYITHSAFFPEPMLSPPQLGDGAPGWWKTPAKDAALAAFNGEPDPAKRGPLWAKVQQVVYDEVPYIRAGNFGALSGVSAKMKGYTADALPGLLERRAELSRAARRGRPHPSPLRAGERGSIAAAAAFAPRRIRTPDEGSPLMRSPTRVDARAMWLTFGRRIGGLIVVMLLVAAMVFFLTRLAPGDPAALMLGDQATAEDIARLRAVYGLDSPVLVQFVLWLKELAQRQSGPVDLPAAARHAGAGRAGRAHLLPHPVLGLDRGADRHPGRHRLGRVAGQGGRPGRQRPGHAGRQRAELLARARSSSSSSPSGSAGSRWPAMATRARRWPTGWATSCCRPACWGCVNSALITRFTRASMLDVLNEDYVRTARVQGRLGSARGAAARLRQRADPDRHGGRPHGGAAGRRRDRHRDGVRPARHRQSRGLGRAAARLPGDPGRADRGRRHLRAHQPR